MRKLFAAAALAVALMTPALLLAGDDHSAWLTDWNKAATSAKKHKRLILTDFTGSDWCGWCIKLKKEVFNTAEFKAWAKDNVVLLELDFPRRTKQADELKAQNQKLMKKYGIRGFPTILFLDADGNKKGKMGYMKGGPKAWIAAAQKIIDAK